MARKAITGNGAVALALKQVEPDVVAAYPIAVLVNAPNPDAAAAFVDFVLSAEGRALLAAYGFASP